MRINPPAFHGIGGLPPVPEFCCRCGGELRGVAVDHPDGFLCGIDCGRPRDMEIPRPASPEQSGCVPFSQTGLEAPR